MKSCCLYVKLGGPEYEGDDEIGFEFDTVDEALVFIKTLSNTTIDYLEYTIAEA